MMTTQFRLPALLAFFLFFSVRLASAQDFLVQEFKGDTITGRILKESSEYLVMQPVHGEKMKVHYHELRSYSYKGKLYQRRPIISESLSGNGFVTEVLKGKVNLYASNGWSSTSFAMAPGGGPGMMPTGGGKITYYYIDKTGDKNGLRNPIATGLMTEKRLQAARKILLDIMGDDEVLAYKINNGVDFDIKMITHYVTEYNKRNPL